MTGKAILLVIAILGIISFRYGQDASSMIIDQTARIKGGYFEIKESLYLWFKRYLDQADYLKELHEDNKKLLQENFLYRQVIGELKKERQSADATLGSSPSLTRVRAISYVNPPSFTRLWIAYRGGDAAKIYGLIYPGSSAGESVAAGIALWAGEERREALLNADSKCAYAVLVGASMAPGIAMGQNSREMVVRYIPNWMEIKVGDEVTTSGLDGIFYAGIKVGRVKSVGGDSAYKEAVIEPYFASMAPDYLYMITKL